MALISKFTNTDPNARVSFSLKRSARKQLDLYRHFYREQYDDADLPERGPLVEQIVVALVARDPDFKKWMDSLKKDSAVLPTVESMLDREEGIEAKTKPAVPVSAATFAAVSAAAPAALAATAVAAGIAASAAVIQPNAVPLPAAASLPRTGTSVAPGAPVTPVVAATPTMGMQRPFGSTAQN